MEPLILILPVVFVVLMVFAAAVLSLIGLWLEHRARVRFLEKLEENPDLVSRLDDVRSVLAGPTPSARAQRQDYALTGLLLTAIGVACIVAGKMLRVGQMAVGVHLGGIVCVAIGILLGLLGLLIRAMSREPAPPRPESAAPRT